MNLDKLYSDAMAQAILFAEKGRFVTAPNPCVGAVLIQEDRLVATGYHTKYGEDHAEVECLKNAMQKNIDTKGATLVVTLEPCAHEGKKPPCTKAIIEAGISTVVIGMRDPNKRASGGVEELRNAGITVIEGVLEDKCRKLVKDYLVWIEEQRPYVILKLAVSLDGKIAYQKGKTYEVTGTEARKYLAKLRANVGAANGLVLVGNNTFKIDNPQLTARGFECEKQPRASIVCSLLPDISSTSTLITERIKECVFLTTHKEKESFNGRTLEEHGAKIYGLDFIKDSNKLDIASILPTLYKEENVNYILCEGGARIGSNLLNQKCVDEYRQFIAPTIFNSSNAINTLDNDANSLPINLAFEKLNHHGKDIELIYTPQYLI